MAIVTDGPMLEPANKGIDEFHVGRIEALGAAAGETWMDSPLSQITNLHQQDIAGGRGVDWNAIHAGTGGVDFGEAINGPAISDAVKPAVPRMDILEANDRVKKAGLDKALKLPNQPDIAPAELEIMMSRAQRRQQYEATQERGPQGFVQSSLSVGTSFLVGAVDPLNVASAFVPVMGELRYAKLLAGAGARVASRTAIRAGVGAAEGATGQALLEPLDWYAHTQEGRDFGMSDVLHNIMFGAVLGGTLHAGGGAIADIYRMRKERPLYPYDLGEPLESHTPWEDLRRQAPEPKPALGEFPGVEAIHVPPEAPRAEPTAHEPIFPEAPEDWRVTAARLAEESRRRLPDVPSAAVQTIDDLPPRAREDAARVAIADLVNGEAVRSGDVLEAAARTDPRIAESFEAWHGSPHDFDRFDISKIGTGEGAQAFGHGLYFAENEATAKSYRESLSRNNEGWENTAKRLVKEATGHDIGDEAARTFLRATSQHPEDDARAAKVAGWGDTQLRALDPGKLANAASAIRNVKPGSIYQVKIKAAREHFLDWDKPLHQQSEVVRRAVSDIQSALRDKLERRLAEERLDLKDLRERNASPGEIETQQSRIESLEIGLHDLDDLTGEEFYRWLARHPTNSALGQAPLANEASKMLADRGVAGIQYLDQGSRGPEKSFDVGAPRGDFGPYSHFTNRADAEKHLEMLRGQGFDDAEIKETSHLQTRNFVVFDDKHVEIIAKNGEPVTPQREEAEQRFEAQPEPVKAKAPRGRAAADPETWSLYEFLAHEGGLKPDQELGAIFGNAKGPFVPGFGALVRPTGRTLDDALRLAKDAGYLFDAADVTGAEGKVAIRDLLDKLAEENAGRKQYRFDQTFATKAEDAAALEREKHEILSLLHDELEATAGQKGAKVDPALEDRVVQIVLREGERDVLAAYERAIMEDAERYEGLASERQNHVETAFIPGWDAPVAEAASAARAASEEQRRTAGLPLQGEGRADRGQPRDAGAGNRAPVQTQLERDASWRQLAVNKPDFDDPDVLARSNAASEVKSVPTKLDERLTAADKAEAFAKQMYDMFADRMPEGERQRLDDLIKGLEDDHKAHEIAIQRGGACLFGARD